MDVFFLELKSFTDHWSQVSPGLWIHWGQTIPILVVNEDFLSKPHFGTYLIPSCASQFWGNWEQVNHCRQNSNSFLTPSQKRCVFRSEACISLRSSDFFPRGEGWMYLFTAYLFQRVFSRMPLLARRWVWERKKSPEPHKKAFFKQWKSLCVSRSFLCGRKLIGSN